MSRYQQPYLSKYHTFNDVNICHKYFSGFAYSLTMHQCTSISLLSRYFTSSSMRVYISDTVFREHPQSLATCRVAHDLVARLTGVDVKKGCEKKRRKKRGRGRRGRDTRRRRGRRGRPPRAGDGGAGGKRENEKTSWKGERRGTEAVEG